MFLKLGKYEWLSSSLNYFVIVGSVLIQDGKGWVGPWQNEELLGGGRGCVRSCAGAHSTPVYYAMRSMGLASPAPPFLSCFQSEIQILQEI